MPSRRKGNSSAKKKAAGGKKKRKKQNDQVKNVETERTGMTTQSLEEIMGTINGLNLGTPAKDTKEKRGLKKESGQEDSEKKMIEETFLLAQREAPTILRRNNYNRGEAVDELKELLTQTSPSLHAKIRADIAGEQIESSLRDLAEEALRYELEKRANYALDLFDMDRSKAVEDVTELIGSDKLGMTVPEKFQQKDVQVKLAKEAVNAAFGAKMTQRRREKQKQKQKSASNGADPSGKPKSHTVGDLSGGWFGDDDYAAVSSEGDISEAQNAMMLEEALRAELKGKAYGVLARCDLDRSKAVEEMKRVVVKVARNVEPTIILPEDETLRLAEDAVNAALKAVQDDGNSRLAQEIRKEHEIQQQRPGAYSVENEASSILRRNDMDPDKAPGPSLAAVMPSNAKEDEDESGLPDLAKNWFATNHRVHPPIGDVLTNDAWCRLAISEMEVEKPEGYKIKADMSDDTFDIWYTAAYVDPSDDFIYYAEQGEGAKLNPTTGVWWYGSLEAAKLAVKRVVAAAQKSRRDAAADDGSCSDIGDSDDESLWELCAHLPLTTDRTCDTCGRRAVAIWGEHGSKGNAIAQCLSCQMIHFMLSYKGPYSDWPSGTGRFRIHSPSEYLGPLLLARVSDFDPRSIDNTPKCVQCGDKIKPARADAVVVLRPCCGNMVCVDCSKPPRDRFGRSECTLCHGSLSRAVGDHSDNFIIRGNCGHVYHFECHCEYFSRHGQRCPECPERWEPSGRYSVAHRCSCGEEVLALPDDEDKVISLLLKKASVGDGYAQYFLGLHHCDLSTFLIPGKKALGFGIKLLERAMERGYVPAFRMLARIHCEGICETEKSIENANNLLRDVDKKIDEFLTPFAAELSLASAKKYREEGNRYRYIQFVKDAAQKGNAEAVGILGNLYLGSRLKSKDEIIQMFRTAVAHGDQSCREKYRFHLANLYREEGNVAKYVKNLKWASHSGHVEATYLVGAYHLVGLYGCKKDLDIALLYLNRARSMGHSVADEVICARLTRSIQLVVYFDENCCRKSERLYINIEPSSTIRIAREMVQTETGVSADAFDLLSTHGKIFGNDTVVRDVVVNEGKPKYQREAFLRRRARDFPGGAALFGSCDSWAYTELKAVKATNTHDGVIDLLKHIMAKCTDPTCKICPAAKDQAHHAAICCKRASGGCCTCQQFWGGVKSHVLHCADTECRIPGCRMWQKKKEEAMREALLPYPNVDGAEV